MNRLNPLYILLLTLILALFAAYSASKKQQELESLQSEYSIKKDIALHLHALKKAYSPKRKRELLQLLHSSRFKKSGIKTEDKRERLLITGKNVDVKAANILLSRLFNNTYNLDKLSVTKAKNGVDLKVEVVWR